MTSPEGSLSSNKPPAHSFDLLRYNKATAFVFALVAIAPLLFSSLIASTLISQEKWLLTLSGTQWLMLFSISSFTMALALTPTTLVALASGYFLGFTGTLFVIPAYLIASSLGFGIGRLLDGGQLLKHLKQHPRALEVTESLTQSGWLVVLLARLSPVLPFALTNLLLPALKIPFSTFMIAGFLGMLPRTLFSIWLGIQTQSLVQLLKNPGHNGFSTALTAILTLVSTIALAYLLQKLISKRLA